MGTRAWHGNNTSAISTETNPRCRLQSSQKGLSWFAVLGTPAPSFCNTKSAANPSTEGKSRDRNQDHSPGSWSCSTKPAPPLTTSPHPPSCIETDCLAHHMLGWADVRSTRASLEWTTSLHPLCRNSIQSSYSRSTTPALSATSSLLCHSQTGLLLPHPAWLMSLMSLMLWAQLVGVTAPLLFAQGPVLCGACAIEGLGHW